MRVSAEQEVTNLVRQRAAQHHAEALLVARGELISCTAGALATSHSARSIEISAIGWLFADRTSSPTANGPSTRVGIGRRSTTIARSRLGAGDRASLAGSHSMATSCCRQMAAASAIITDRTAPGSVSATVRNTSTRETGGDSLS